MKSCHLCNKNGPRGYYAKGNKSEKDKYYDFIYTWNLKHKLNIKQKQTHRHRKQTYGYQRGKGEGERETRRMGLTDTNYFT